MSSCSGIVVTAGGFSSKWFSITKKGSARQSGGGGGGGCGGKGGLCIAYKLWLILFGTSVDLHCITFHCLCQYSDGPFMCRQYQIVECALEANRSLSKYILSIDYSSILWTVCVAVDMAKSLQKKKKNQLRSLWRHSALHILCSRDVYLYLTTVYIQTKLYLVCKFSCAKRGFGCTRIGGEHNAPLRPRFHPLSFAFTFSARHYTLHNTHFPIQTHRHTHTIPPTTDNKPQKTS